MRNYKVAIVGAGQIAHTHLKAMRQSVRSHVVAIADLMEDRVRQVGAEYGCLAYTDYRKMIVEQKPDIVIITLPHFLHKEAAIWCAGQGCHILLEKPMALNVAECMEINAAAERNGITFAVGHIQQFFQENIAAKAIVASGELGELVMVNDRRSANYFTASRPAWFLDRAKSGGGIMINLGSHSIDRIQWLTGTRIARVRANMTYFGGHTDVEGSASLYLETEDEVPAHISLHGRSGVTANELELLFTKGSMRIRRHGAKLEISKGGPYEEAAVEPTQEPFAAQWDHFLSALENGTPLSISGAYGQSIIAVVEASYRSDETRVEQQVRLDSRIISR